MHVAHNGCARGMVSFVSDIVAEVLAEGEGLAILRSIG